MGRWSHTPVPPFQKSSSPSDHRPHPRSRRCTHTMHSLTCMLVVVCVVRKPRPCNSYSRRRDRINSVLWRSYYKGGGVLERLYGTIGGPHCRDPLQSTATSPPNHLLRPRSERPPFWSGTGVAVRRSAHGGARTPASPVPADVPAEGVG